MFVLVLVFVLVSVSVSVSVFVSVFVFVLVYGLVSVSVSMFVLVCLIVILFFFFSGDASHRNSLGQSLFCHRLYCRQHGGDEVSQTLHLLLLLLLLLLLPIFINTWLLFSLTFIHYSLDCSFFSLFVAIAIEAFNKLVAPEEEQQHPAAFGRKISEIRPPTAEVRTH